VQKDLEFLLQTSFNEITQIIEGTTKLLVPIGSLNDKIPPKEPAFFNPKAKLNRDFSVIAYSSFLKNFVGQKIFLDGMSGLGARGLRVAKEISSIDKVVINDLNPKSLELVKKSAMLNDLHDVEISENEVCRFLSSYSRKGKRGTIVDIDPFGSPSKYIDCAIRATMHGGLLSTTATDLQVLHGLFQKACKRRYYGVPIKTEYANEIAIRLILGCINLVASRLDIQIIPLFADNAMHYYRTYVMILNRPNNDENMGYILHCQHCGHRILNKTQHQVCEICESKIDVAGPLWKGQLFDKEFVKTMLEEISHFHVDKKCNKVLEKCLQESQMPGTYFTLDEIASKAKVAPMNMKTLLKKLQEDGFLASPTSLNPTGFRTNTKIDKITEIFENYTP